MAQLKGLGTEDKRKVAIAAGLGVVVLALAFNTLFGGGSPAPPSVPAVPVRPAATAALPPNARGGAPAGSSADPALHPELMAETESFLYAGSGRNIFSRESAPPPIERPASPARPSQQTPPTVQAVVNTGPPPPPPVDLKFFGFAARKNGTRRVFLTHGEDVFVASEGDVVSHRYKIVSIAPSSVQVEDLAYRNTQTLPLVNN